MIDRCYNTRQMTYPKYGGRGITVCDEWRTSFAAFHKALGPRPSDKHSIDRINTLGHYEPSNCRWATAKQQARNRRTSRYVTFGGDTMTLAELAERFAMDQTVLAVRLRCGWSLEKATGTPVLPRRLQRREA